MNFLRCLLIGGVVALGIEWPANAGTLQLLRKIPHSGYSEGLSWNKGYLWNSFPKFLKKIDAKEGTVLDTFSPPSEYSESLEWWGDTLWNVSFSDNGIYAGHLRDGKLVFERKGSTPEDHAWGLTHDEIHLIMTGNYSNKIYFVSPKTLKVERSVTAPVKDIEDLAWDGTSIWASSFTEHRGQVFRIDPKNGGIDEYFDLPDRESCPVIDGIAFDGKALWITGKECPSIIQVKVPSNRSLTSK